jgi:hypothetical protein
VPRGRNLLFNDFELLEALNEVAEVLEYNRVKYPCRPMPWKKKTREYHLSKHQGHIYSFDALRYWGLPGLDKETGKSHLAHAIGRLLMALALDRRTRHG